MASENRDSSVPLIENEERRGPILGLAPSEFLLAVLFVLLVGLAGLLQYKQSQLDTAKRELDAVFNQTGQGRGMSEQPSGGAGPESRDARLLAEQTLRIAALDSALNETRRERDALRTEIAELRPLQIVADNAAKIDPSRPRTEVLQRAISVVQALGITNDPPRAVQELKQQNDELRRQLATNRSELAQISRENETLTRDSRRERDAMQAELAELRPLKPLADAAAKLDPRQSAPRVMQRALAVLESVGNSNGDPARAVRDLKTETEELRKRVSTISGENEQLRREKDGAVRDARQEREALRAELSDLQPLKAAAEAAAKIDPRRPPQALLQESLAALQALGSTSGDPARAIQQLKASNKELERKLAAPGPPDEARRARDEIEKENETLRSELSGLQAFKPIAEAASKIAPGEPPATVVQRALSIFSSSKMSAGAESAEASRKEESEELQRKLAALMNENEKLQREKTALVRSGNLDFPSCWANQQGDTEFLLEVTIKDGAVSVRDIAPASRQSDPNLRLLARLPRDTDMRPDTFRAAVAPLYRWSVRQKCRFFVQMQDGTSETSKGIYKKARQMVEGVFYVKHL